MKPLVRFLLPLSFLAAGIAFAHENAIAADKPNTIVIFTDDHGFSDLNCQGIQADLKTPNIDELAAAGVRMTSGYVTAPQCVPSRAGLLSGRSQNRFGVESNGLSLSGFNEQQTIADRLKKAGYATGMTGKWHLGPASEIVDHGFNDVYFKNSNRPGWSNYLLDGTDCKPGPEPSKLYHLDANSEAACAFIKRHHDEPFFFYCAYRAPHVPLDAPKKYLDRFPGKMPERRRQALAMISAMDDGVGKIMGTLRKYGIEENTMIWIIGDNGAPLKIHKTDAPGGGPGWDGSLNEPLNGEKGMLSEGGIRVPFLVYWKDKISSGREYHHPVSSLDVAATATQLAGLKLDEKLDGVNLIPFLTGENDQAPHEFLYWRWTAQAAVRSGKWKFLRGGQRQYLFDLDADQQEKNNLIDAHPDIAKRLSIKLTEWANELQPAGLATSKMSEAADRYFDFYLDGKPAPPQRSKPPAISQQKSHEESEDIAQGWKTRNSKLTKTMGGIRVSPQAGKVRPFIVASKLKLPPDATVRVRMRTKSDGKAGFQWRESSQKDFEEKQMATFRVERSDQWIDHMVRFSGKEKIVHLRFLLPSGGADIQSIEIDNPAGKSLKRWQF